VLAVFAVGAQDDPLFEIDGPITVVNGDNIVVNMQTININNAVVDDESSYLTGILEEIGDGFIIVSGQRIAINDDLLDDDDDDD
jgi:hypothetical protein